jgi:hypothetical protein
MPKNKVALVRGKAAELNAPLLSGYLEPGKQPYSFSRDSKRKSFHVIKKPSRDYNGLACLGIRVVSLTVCVCEWAARVLFIPYSTLDKTRGLFVPSSTGIADGVAR